MNRVHPLKELACIFNNPEMAFENFFLDHEHGDEDLRSLYSNDFREYPEKFLKGAVPISFISTFRFTMQITSVLCTCRSIDARQSINYDHG